jgi:hypothetical protein
MQMKPFAISALLLQSVSGLNAQGTMYFNNYVPPVVITHIYAPLASDLKFSQIGNGPADNPSGPTDWSRFTLIGANGISGPYGATTTFAQLLGATGFDQPESNLLPAHPTSTFRTGAASGFISGNLSTFLNVPFANPATIQMVAWDNTSALYPTWTEASAAWQAGLIAAGMTERWNQFMPGPGADPPPIYGARSFNLYYLTPEPSPLALAALAAMWLVFRRHSNKHNTPVPD